MTCRAERWRSALATWGGAFLLAMHQFGTLPANNVEREEVVVRVEDANERHRSMERLSRNTVLTLPAELASQPSDAYVNHGSSAGRWGVN